MMKKDGVVSSSSYEEYILNHLQELDRGQYASEPTTKNDLGIDCIDREETLKAMDTWDKFGLDSHGYMRRITKDKNINLVPYVHYEDIVNCIKNMPSVTPQEPKIGHWISTETKGVRYAFWCRYKCSLCGELSDYKNFCPNCGAKMESKENENG